MSSSVHPLNISPTGATITPAPRTLTTSFLSPPTVSQWNTAHSPQIISRTAKKAGVEKRVTPHLFRKSRITSLIKQNYQESVIKQAMWGNLGTNMFKTYVVLSEQDIDAEFREKMGLEKKEIKEDKKMAPRE